MDGKGIGLSAIIISAVAILVGLALYNGIFSENIGKMTQTSSIINSSFTMPAAGATSELTMCGQKALTFVAINKTAEVIPTNNYTISQSAGTDGYLAAKITTTAGPWAGKPINVTCTYEPKGYVADAGSRGIVGLIAIFMALLIAVAAIPDARNWMIDQFR